MEAAEGRFRFLHCYSSHFGQFFKFLLRLFELFSLDMCMRCMRQTVGQGHDVIRDLIDRKRPWSPCFPMIVIEQTRFMGKTSSVSNVKPSQPAFISHRSRNLLKSGLLSLQSTRLWMKNRSLSLCISTPWEVGRSRCSPADCSDGFGHTPDRYVTWRWTCRRDRLRANCRWPTDDRRQPTCVECWPIL